jgi:hypothetical protein
LTIILDMTKKKGHPSRFTRLVIYPIIGVIFLIVLAGVILLATGYKLTVENNHLAFKKTGMIIVHTRPNDGHLFLNGKDINKNTLPIISTKINSLLPGDYFLEIKKDGYINWHKNLRVYPDLVTWANYVLLFPIENKPAEQDDLNGYRVIGSNKTNRYLFIEKTGQNGQRQFKQYDTSNKEIKEVWPQNFSPVEKWLQNPEIVSADYNSDSRKILLTVKNGASASYAVLDTGSGKLIAVATAPNLTFSKVIWNPSNNSELLTLSAKALYRVNTDILPNTHTRIEEEVVDFGAVNNTIYYVATNKQNYALNRIQTDGSRKTIIAESVLPSSHYKFQYSNQNNKLALLATDSGNLTVYYYLNNLFSSIKLGEGIKDMSWSKDGERLNYYNENTIFCYDWEKQKELVTRSDTKIDKMTWYFDNYHLFYRDDKGFGVVEFDGGNKTALGENIKGAYVVNQSSFIYSKEETSTLKYYNLNLSF